MTKNPALRIKPSQWTRNGTHLDDVDVSCSELELLSLPARCWAAGFDVRIVPCLNWMYHLLRRSPFLLIHGHLRPVQTPILPLLQPLRTVCLVNPPPHPINFICLLLNPTLLLSRASFTPRLSYPSNRQLSDFVYAFITGRSSWLCLLGLCCSMPGVLGGR